MATAMPTTVMSSTRCKLAGLLAATMIFAACSIGEDASPRPIPDEEQGQLGGGPTGDAAAGSNRIFLLATAQGDGQTILRSVLREVPNDPEAILTSLLAGPNAAEQNSQLQSALPDGLELIEARQRGPLLTVDVSNDFAELRSDSLRPAVAQIVATATAIEGVQQVRLRIDGQIQVWPLGNGETTDRQLTIYDYPGFVESTQPDYPGLPTVNA